MHVYVCVGVVFLPACLTQVRMDKKEKAMAARAASEACSKGSLDEVRLHWLARKQNPTNQRNAQSPAKVSQGKNRKEKNSIMHFFSPFTIFISSQT